MWSIPEINPLAIAGAAPSTITNRIALSFRPKSRMAKGNQAIDGMLWSPVMIEPTADRRRSLRETATPTTRPTMIGEEESEHRSLHRDRYRLVERCGRDDRAEFREHCGRQRDHVGRSPAGQTRACHPANTIAPRAAWAISRPRLRRARLPTSIRGCRAIILSRRQGRNQ